MLATCLPAQISCSFCSPSCSVVPNSSSLEMQNKNQKFKYSEFLKQECKLVVTYVWLAVMSEAAKVSTALKTLHRISQGP